MLVKGGGLAWRQAGDRKAAYGNPQLHYSNDITDPNHCVGKARGGDVGGRALEGGVLFQALSFFPLLLISRFNFRKKGIRYKFVRRL